MAEKMDRAHTRCATTTKRRAVAFSVMENRTRNQSFCVFERLRSVGLRPTRQRVALCNLMFGSGDRHLSAEELYEEAQKAAYRSLIGLMQSVSTGLAEEV